MIDGVDVGECGFLVIQKHCDIESDDIFKACYNKDCKYSICSENPDCLYKMYKRKEKECEELETNNIYLRDRTGKLERAIIRRNKQLQRKTAECEELKKKKEENETFYLRKYANKDSECLELQRKLRIATETLDIIANQNVNTPNKICNLAEIELVPCTNNCKYCLQAYAQRALGQIESEEQ